MKCTHVNSQEKFLLVVSSQALHGQSTEQTTETTPDPIPDQQPRRLGSTSINALYSEIRPKPAGLPSQSTSAFNLVRD